MNSPLIAEFCKEWDDMSDYVVHITRGDRPKENPYDSMMGILSKGVIEARNPFGVGRSSAPDVMTQHACCFSEIPLGKLQRLVEKRRTCHGIGFRKSFLLAQGGGPIWYVYKDTPPWRALQAILDGAVGHADSDIWKLTPFIDAPGDYGESRPYFFEWEREWRLTGDLCFGMKDVAFLLIPEDLHAKAQEFFETVKNNNLGLMYSCPYIDPCWDREKTVRVLGGL